MVDKIHYRWDFIGLSTDSKPTPAESPKVVDGSTYYESDTSKLYVFYKDTWYEKTATGGGTSYTAGEGIDITNNEISVDTETIQPKLTAGTNITIDEDNVISAEGGGATVVQTIGTSTTDVMSQKAVTDELYNNANSLRVQIGNNAVSTGESYFSTIAVGTSSEATKRGAVAVGQFAKVSGRDSISIGSDSECTQVNCIAIGNTAKVASTTAVSGIAIGYGANSIGENNLVVGNNAQIGGTSSGLASYSVALGAYSKPTLKGQVDISTLNSTNTYGYNDSQYRLLSGLYDGQSAHDAVTVEQVNSVIDAINTALSTSIPHIGA